VADLFFDQDEEADDRPYTSRRERRTGGRRRGRWLAPLAAIVILAVVAAGAGGLWVQRRIDPPGAAGPVQPFTVPDGASGNQVGELLESEGLIESATVWRYYLRVKNEGGFDAGTYDVPTNASLAEVIAALRGPAALAPFVNLTVPEGLWVPEVAERVGTVERFSSQTFLDLVNSGTVRSVFQPDDVSSMEGLLFPDTYRIEEDEDEAALLTRMVGTLDAIATELGYEDAEARVGLSPYEALVVASLIESEASIPEDRPKIARVIYNRIEQGMPLEIDATVYFALGRRGGGLTRSDLEVDSPYNTRRFGGLPPTPIAMPGRASLEAALNPEPGPWLFYVLSDAQGHHAFSESYEEFLRNKAQAEEDGLL
jgi:UPF0755 protein